MAHQAQQVHQVRLVLVEPVIAVLLRVQAVLLVVQVHQVQLETRDLLNYLLQVALQDLQEVQVQRVLEELVN